jgi:hypothetical protein
LTKLLSVSLAFPIHHSFHAESWFTFEDVFVDPPVTQNSSIARGTTMRSIRVSLVETGIAFLIVIAALFISTQWAAGMLGNQPALGDPLLHVLGLKLYAPWKLFEWWLAFDRQEPDAFARAGAVAAFGGLASGAIAIGGAAWRTSLNRKPTTYGSHSAPGMKVGRCARLKATSSPTRPAAEAACCGSSW